MRGAGRGGTSSVVVVGALAVAGLLVGVGAAMNEPREKKSSCGDGGRYSSSTKPTRCERGKVVLSLDSVGPSSEESDGVGLSHFGAGGLDLWRASCGRGGRSFVRVGLLGIRS